jgi:hypothetical protein
MASIKAGLYLRQNTAVTPGVLCFDNGTLIFKTTEKTVFELQANDVLVHFSNYGTITLTRGQEKWVFVAGGYSGAFPPLFSKDQLSELNAGENSISLAAKTHADEVVYGWNNPSHDIAEVVNGGKGYASGGTIRLSIKQRSSFYSNLALVEFLGDQGFQVVIKSKKFSTSQWILFIAIVGSLAVFSVAVYTILSAVQG